MIHNEHLRKADELYEIRHDQKGNAIHSYIKDGNAIVYATLDDLIQNIYFGKAVQRMHCLESDLEIIYENKSYEFNKLKDIYDFAVLNAFRTINSEHSDSGDILYAWAYLIKTGVAFKINSYYTSVASDYINTNMVDENGDII